MSRIIPPSRTIGLLLLVAGLLLLSPIGLAQGSDNIHLTITIADDGSVDETTNGVVAERLIDEPGERYAWQITPTADQTYVEVHYSNASMDIDRARQLVPALDAEPPYFHAFPRAEVWETQGPARVFHVGTDANGDHVLRLQIHGTGPHNLTLSRDTDAPTFELGPVTNIDHTGFDQQTTSDEYTIANLRWSPADGSAAPVENPTPTYDVLHNFPVQGMDPETRYRVNVTFTDWAGNTATSATYSVETLGPRYEALPTLTVDTPQPETTVPPGQDLEIRVRIEPHANDTLRPNNIRVFVDLQERTDLLVTRAPDGVTYTTVVPGGLEAGPHVLSMEAETDLGAVDHVRWTIQAGETAISETPAPALWGPLLIALALVRAGRRTDDRPATKPQA